MSSERETKVILQKADALWRRWSCPGTAACCKLKQTGLQPWIWPSEWRVLTEGRPLPPVREDGHCPFLGKNELCTRYEDRPLGCRTYFCHRVKGPPKVPVMEMDALMVRLERVNLDEDENARPRPILEYFEEQK